ncbi:MAG: methyltransferase domain-containing protein [Chloroflexi bacterium]|nr:methyltransferase domain-containing protein [Chloroflexota bacterium]
MAIKDTVWQTNELTQKFLTGVRGAIPLADLQIDTMLRLIDRSQTAVTRFLDLGCGDGILGQAILDRFPEATGLFVDFSQPMLEAARERLAGYNGRAAFRQVDFGMRDWRLEIGDYNVIISGYAIHHQTDARKKEIYAEIYSLLQPGGIFVNVEHVACRSALGEQVAEDVFVDAMVVYHREMGDGRSRDQLTQDLYHRYRPDSAANILAPVEEQCGWLREIGFVEVDCYLRYLETAVFGGIKPEK